MAGASGSMRRESPQVVWLEISDQPFRLWAPCARVQIAGTDRRLHQVEALGAFVRDAGECDAEIRFAEVLPQFDQFGWVEQRDRRAAHVAVVIMALGRFGLRLIAPIW